MAHSVSASRDGFIEVRFVGAISADEFAYAMDDAAAALASAGHAHLLADFTKAQVARAQLAHWNEAVSTAAVKECTIAVVASEVVTSAAVDPPSTVGRDDAVPHDGGIRMFNDRDTAIRWLVSSARH